MPPTKLGDSLLVTPAPHHIPGYSGFFPQFIDEVGDTFARTTHRLLTTDQKEARPPGYRSLLKDVHLPSVTINGNLAMDDSERKTIAINNRVNRWGNQKLVNNMTPGYTGCIPRKEHYFGNRYPNICTDAIYEFETDCRDLHAKRQKLAAQSLPPTPSTDQINYHRPLRPIAPQARSYTSQYDRHLLMSQLFIENINPNKTLKSGYTGVVPRIQGQFGSNYLHSTQNALNEFANDRSRLGALAHQPIQLHRQEIKNIIKTKLYPASGLIPYYCGHIPGEKFRYGATFGNSTKNVLKA